VATVTFLGSGDAVSSGGRFQACILVATPERRVLLDCGASSLVAMKRAAIDPAMLDAIFVSHLHGDHFAGIPFLVLDGQLAHRTRPLVVAGPTEVERRVRTAMIAMYPGFATEPLRFPLEFVELAAGAEDDVAGVRVRAWSVPHDPLSNPLALRVALSGVTIGYSGDTAWTPALREVAAGADLFVCEAQTMAPKARIHVSYAEVLAHRDEFGAKRIVLTHLGADVIAAESLALERAHDGLVVALEERKGPALRGAGPSNAGEPS
jgi:ribonuclease BN (tRNA processing enzyme)